MTQSAANPSTATRAATPKKQPSKKETSMAADHQREPAARSKDLWKRNESGTKAAGIWIDNAGNRIRRFGSWEQRTLNEKISRVSAR